MTDVWNKISLEEFIDVAATAGIQKTREIITVGGVAKLEV